MRSVTILRLIPVLLCGFAWSAGLEVVHEFRALPKQADRFISVQSVVVDPRDRLWVLDTGRQKQFHAGKDLRRLPYLLFRIRVDAKRIVQ